MRRVLGGDGRVWPERSTAIPGGLISPEELSGVSRIVRQRLWAGAGERSAFGPGRSGVGSEPIGGLGSGNGRCDSEDAPLRRDDGLGEARLCGGHCGGGVPGVVLEFGSNAFIGATGQRTHRPTLSGHAFRGDPAGSPSCNHPGCSGLPGRGDHSRSRLDHASAEGSVGRFFPVVGGIELWRTAESIAP